MKKLSLVLIVPCLVAVFTLDIDAQMAKKKKIPDAVQVTRATPSLRTSFCPENYDLAASVTSITTGSDSTGPYLRINGKVTNIGGIDFTDTSTYGTHAYISVIRHGVAAGTQVKRQNIASLRKMQSVNLSGTFRVPDWDEWCGWGCIGVDLHGGVCSYYLVSVGVGYSDESVRTADCNASNNHSPDKEEYHISFIRRCAE